MKLIHLFLFILFIFNINLPLSSQIVRNRTATIEENLLVERSMKPKASFLFGIDPNWLIRGIYMANFEHSFGELSALRVNVGMSTTDYISNSILGNLITRNYTIGDSSPKVAFGLEYRYYPDKIELFEGWLFAIGFSKRSYQYSAISRDLKYSSQTIVYPTSKSLDIYVRCGTMYQLMRKEKTSLALEFGISAGISDIQYYLPQTYSVTGNTNSRIWILPHVGLNYMMKK